eukprot:jgi/Botrbrau1/6735/Bobra.0324s0021.1
MQGLDAPVLHPTRKEFNGSFGKWYESVERTVQSHGIVKVKGPKGWKPRPGYGNVDQFVIHKPVEQAIAGRIEDGVFRATQLERRGMTVRQFREIAKERAYRPSLRKNKGPPDQEKDFWQTVTVANQLYGADVPGSFFEDDIKGWNLNKLDCMLTRVLDAKAKKIPGVNTAYLYFGTWRSTFPWHTEDKDLASINYLHFGAPKMWYCVPPKDRHKFEDLMRSKFPDATKCPEFLRHKAFLAMPSWLEKHGIHVIKVVQQPGEFIISAPGAYHSGFNFGFNCAESTNFATESWLQYGAQAQSCNCRADTVKIDMRMFLDVATGRLRSLIKASCPSPSPSESDSVSEETSSSGSASDDSSLASDGEQTSSLDSKPCPKKRGRPPAAVPQPRKQARKSPDSVVPMKKRGRPPSGKAADPAKAAGPAKAPAALLGKATKGRRLGDDGLPAVQKPVNGASAAAAGQAAGPGRPVRRTGVPLVRTTAAARRAGPPGSRQRERAMKAIRKKMGIAWSPQATAAVWKPKPKLLKRKPGRPRKFKSSDVLRQSEDVSQKGGAMTEDTVCPLGQLSRCAPGKAPPLLESGVCQQVASAGPRRGRPPASAGLRKRLAEEVSLAEAGMQDLGSPQKRRGRRPKGWSNGEELQGCVGQPTVCTGSPAVASLRLASGRAPFRVGPKTGPLWSKHGEGRDGAPSHEAVPSILHLSGSKVNPPQWVQGKDGPPSTPPKQAPACDLGSLLGRGLTAPRQPQVGGKTVTGQVLRTSERPSKPTFKAASLQSGKS